jgi:hypothetical protein
MTSLGLLVPSTHLAIPPRGVRASRLADLLRVLQVADYDAWRQPALVAAATAFMHRISRVVLATSLDALLDLDAIVDLAPHEPAPLPPPSDSPPIFTTGPDDTTLAALVTALALAADTPPADLAAEAPQRRLYPTLGKASVLVTQHPRMVPVPPSVLAATLYVGGAPTLLPTVEYLAPPHDVDTLADLGFIVLRALGPSRRVARGFGFPSPRRSEPDVAAGAELAPSGQLTVDSPTTWATSATSATSGPAPLPPELASLRSALGALCERFSYRLPSDPSGMKVIDREAKKLLQAEVVAGRIKGFALAIVPTGDDLQDLGLEVVVTLPRRVGQVILTLTPMPNRTSP